MASLRISVGASLESNALTVFEPLERRAQRARKVIETELGGAARAMGGPYRTNAKQAGDALDGVGGKAKTLGRTTGKSVDEIRGKFTALAKSAQKGLDFKSMAAAAERELKKVENAAARAQLGFGKKESIWSRDLIGGSGGAIGIGRRAGIRVNRGAALAFGLAGSAASFAARTGSEILRGSGVETDFSSMVAAGVGQRKSVSEIVNSGYMPGSPGAAGKLQDPDAVLREARGVGVSTGTDTSTILEGLQDFVGKTGDLQMGREMLKDMATLSRATGSSMADVSNAAAEVSNNLGDIPDKAKVTYAIMRQIAGQGKLGAVEVRDLASQMAKVAATARQFEGGAEKNIGILGAIAQEAKARGGAASATQAATSVTAFATALKTGATIKNWKKMGMTPFTDESETQLASPDKLIQAALKATDKGKGANLEELRKLFPSSQAMRAVQGFAGIYNDAGGGDAGAKAVSDEFDRLAKAGMDQEEVLRAFNQSMGTTEAKVTVFNNQMQAVAEQVANAVLPAFIELAPEIVGIASTMADTIAELTGVKDKIIGKQVDAAEKTKATDDEILKKGTHKRMVFGASGMEMQTTYDDEALEVLKKHNVERGAAKAELTQKLTDEIPDDPTKTLPNLAGGRYSKTGASSAVNAFFGEGTSSMGLGGLAEYFIRGGKGGTTGREQTIAQDKQDLAKLTADQASALQTQRQIHSAILEQTAVIEKLKVAAPSAGAAPSTESPVPVNFTPNFSR